MLKGLTSSRTSDWILIYSSVHRSCCEELLSSLKSTHCLPSFSEEGLKLECTLTPKTASFKSLSKAWEVSSRNSVHKYLEERVTDRWLMTDDRVWDELMQFLNSGMFAGYAY